MRANYHCRKDPMICRRFIVWLMVLSLSSIAVAVSTARAQHTFQECDSIDESALRAELNTIAQSALSTDSLGIDRIVDNQWSRLRLDTIVDDEIDRAVAAIKSNENYLARLWSGWSAEKATELATRVADQAFGSEPFQSAITALSSGIAIKVVAAMETAAARSASSALSCMQAFIGTRYSHNLTEVFGAEIKQQVNQIDFGKTADPNVSTTQLHGTALTGLGVIIAGQIGRRLATRLTQRIAGRIVGRVVGRAAASLIPLAGWVVGAGLIVWDLVEGADGALPTIQQALKQPQVKQEIRQEVVLAVKPELESELPKVARQVADDIFSSWVDFKKQYRNVLQLAEQQPEFQSILATASTQDIYKLSRLVTTWIDKLGRSQLQTAIANNQFERVFNLPASAITMLANTRSVEQLIDWSELAGSQFDAVTRLEIYKARKPQDFDRESLSNLIAVNDKHLVAKLLLLDNNANQQLFLSLPTEHLRSLVTRLEADDLEWLAAFLATLEQPEQRSQLVARLIKHPLLMSQLKNKRLQKAIAESGDINQALDFVAADFSVGTTISDTVKLFQGAVSIPLFWHKYGTPQNIAIFAGIIVLLGFRSWWRNRRLRPPPVVINMPADKKH